MEARRFKYDLAISFAGEQRALAEMFASRLDAAGYAVFYDDYERAEFWGRDLATVLQRPYAYEARYCLIVLSSEYLAKPWTEFERKHAISRFIAQRGDYVLCLKIDDVELPGFPDSIAYVTISQLGEDDRRPGSVGSPARTDGAAPLPWPRERADL